MSAFKLLGLRSRSQPFDPGTYGRIKWIRQEFAVHSRLLALKLKFSVLNLKSFLSSMIFASTEAMCESQVLLWATDATAAVFAVFSQSDDSFFLLHHIYTLCVELNWQIISRTSNTLLFYFLISKLKSQSSSQSKSKLTSKSKSKSKSKLKSQSQS